MTTLALGRDSGDILTLMLFNNCPYVSMLVMFSFKVDLSHEKYMNGCSYPAGEETKASVKTSFQKLTCGQRQLVHFPAACTE